MLRMSDESAQPGASGVVITRPAPADAPVERRIVAAAVACIAERGVARTTLDDVARVAGCGRATIYRTFAGGKDAVVAVAASAEFDRLLDRVGRAMAATSTFEDAVVVALHESYCTVVAHPALRRVLAHEPELLLPHLSFQGLDRLLGVVGDVAEPALARFVDPVTARTVGEWIARIVVSRASGPTGAVPTAGPSGGIAGCGPDLRDPDAVRRLVRTYLLPGVAATAPPPPDRSHPLPVPTPAPFAFQE
jgi:AcrR family transcriptional regulator